MKRVYSIISVVLMLVFCLTALPVAAAPVATASIGTVTAMRGETVTVPVSITEVSNIGAIALHIRYDSSVLECVAAEAVGIMDQMDMNTANTEPQNRPDQVWLTGMGLAGMSGSGELMIITFKVKEDAPTGLSAIEFTEEGQELILGSPIEALEMALTNGGIMVKEGQAVATTEPPLQSGVVTTAPPATTNVPASTDTAVATTAAPNDAAQAPATEPTTVPTSVVVTREDGTQVTDQQGQAVTMDAIGISVDKVAGKPGDTVTVNVSVSKVTELTAMGISVRYDTEALKFVSGESKGFLAEMSFSDVSAEADLVSIGGTNPKTVSGEGVIATLTFTITNKAKAGEHSLKLDPAPMLLSDTIDLPYEVFNGAVTVEGNGIVAADTSTTIYIFLGVGLAAVVALAVMLIARKKKAGKSKESKPAAPKQTKPGLPTDITEDDF